jgi:penicillin-binding protein 1C
MEVQWVAKTLFNAAVLSVLIVVVTIATLFAAVGLTPLPKDLLHPQNGTTTVVDCRGKKLASLASTEARAQHPLALREMGSLPAVTVALEDARFYTHCGIDIRATLAALVRNIRAGRIVSGGSTVTQQLIKLSCRRMERSWTAKIYENLAALRLELTWPKDHILEEYLNRSHYGNRQVGPAAAAQAYFDKSPENLTLAEAIYLAGLPQAPTRFNPWRNAAAAEEKYRRSVSQLSRAQFFGPRQSGSINAFPRLSSRPAEQRSAPHFVDAVLQKHPNLGGGIVATTLDLDLQSVAEKELALELAKLAPRRVRHGAVVILDTDTGAVRALVGSRDYYDTQDGQINGAAIYRSCGSTLKPFVYLHAIENRVVTAATLLPDTPDAVRAEYIDYDPVNYDNTFLGPTRVREALASSLNVPAVVTLSRVGARKAFLALEDCGLKFARPFSEYGAGLILGNAEVRLLDMTAAFTIFSGRGLAVEPQSLSTENPRHRFVASPEAVSIVADILADNDARIRTFGPFSPLAFENQRIPCKTGTSSGFRDAWAVGVTAQHAVGVWVGNFDGSPMEEVAAITGAAPVWRAIVDYLLQHGDTSVPEPVENARLHRRQVCALTGMLPSRESPRIVNEWFLAGTEPVQNADQYWRVVDGRRRLVLPPEYALWCRSGQNGLGAKVDDTSPLRIVSPHPDATFVIDPQLSRSQQAVQLVASADIAEKLVWKVDGKTLEPSRNGYFWSLIEGRHTIEVFGSSRHATSRFSVE